MRIRVALLVGAAIAVAGCSTVYREAAPVAAACQGGGDLEQAACMIALGQPTYVAVPQRKLGRSSFGFTVQALSPKTRDQARADLEACDRPGVAAQEKTATAALIPGSLGMYEAERLARETATAYGDCMRPRGYRVDRWQPTRSMQ